jgi:hypothetical protein
VQQQHLPDRRSNTRYTPAQQQRQQRQQEHQARQAAAAAARVGPLGVCQRGRRRSTVSGCTPTRRDCPRRKSEWLCISRSSKAAGAGAGAVKSSSRRSSSSSRSSSLQDYCPCPDESNLQLSQYIKSTWLAAGLPSAVSPSLQQQHS